MSLIVIDGFDHYVTADIPKKGWNIGASPAIGPTSGRRGGGGLLAPNGSSAATFITKNVPASASWVMGFSFKASILPFTNVSIARLFDAGTLQCELTLKTDGTLSVTRNGTALTGGTSTPGIVAGVEYYIEWKVTIADAIAANSCKVRVNNADWATVATGQDTKNTANAFANQVSIGAGASVTLTATWTFDDVYVCDQSGTINNDFLGDVRIDTLFPNADGTYSQFTPSTGTNHFVLVDETTPNTTDYNDGLTVGNRDSYQLTNLASIASQNIYGVQVNAAVLKDDAGAKSACTFVRSGTTDSDASSAALGTTQNYVSQIFEMNPNGGVAWTEASVNSMESGLKVTA